MILFIEPNPFASRLHVLKPLVIAACRVSEQVIVLCPGREGGEDWTTFADDLPSNSEVVVVESLAAKPRQKVGWSTLWNLALAAGAIRHTPKTTLVLTAIDDYIAFLPVFALVLNLKLRIGKCFLIRYRVADLLPGARLLALDRCKRAVTNFTSAVLRAKTLVFDERIPTSDRLSWLPDPWHGPFGQTSRTAAREALRWDAGWQVVAFVGAQDDRKGFDVGTRAVLDAATRLPNLRVVVIGPVSANLDWTVGQLQGALGNRFTQIKDFISDAELATLMAAADVICLPYHLRFTSTSGVLVRAAASGTPVVTSEHGLIGWRVRQHRLGQTFAFPQHSEMALAIERTLNSEVEPGDGLGFAARSSAEALAAAFERVIRG